MFRRRKLNATQDLGEVSTNIRYPSRLSFYNIQPANDITIDEFEQWAVDRLNVISNLERHTGPGGDPKKLATEMAPVLAKHMPLKAHGKPSDLDYERMKDHYSHFILRLCFCRTPENQAKYVDYEKKLFSLRWDAASQQERRDFIASSSMGLTKLTPEELGHVPKRFKTENMFKVDWTSVPDLVAKQRVYLREGFAYIDEAQQTQYVANEFARSLSQGLVNLARIVTQLNEDDRLLPILDHMQDCFALGDDERDTRSANVTVEDIDKFDQMNKLPLCMSAAHRHNMKQHRAKHQSRVSFTLFLKHTGLSFDGTYKYWQKLFADPNDFKKQVYNFEHSYGLRGSRHKYGPPKCTELARQQETAEDKCACPFAQKQGQIVSYLKERGITNSQDIEYIKEKSANKSYHLSCTRVYELTQGQRNIETILSPNDYFERATRDILKVRSEDSPKSSQGQTPVKA